LPGIKSAADVYGNSFLRFSVSLVFVFVICIPYMLEVPFNYGLSTECVGGLVVDLQGKALLDMQDYLFVEMRLTSGDIGTGVFLGMRKTRLKT